MPRRPIADMIEDMEAPLEASEPSAPPAAAAPESPSSGEPREGAPRAQRRRASGPARPRPAKAARPAARDLVAPVKQNIPREALKVDVPVDLALLQRLHRRRLDTGIDLRDQVAIAVDEYLTAEGY
jgi:hypothetical protein